MIKEKKGEQGDQCIQGEQGDKGLDGISVKSAYIDNRGHLILVLSDGTIIDAGKVSQGYTEGLEYIYGRNAFTNDITAIVKGIGAATDYDIVIPPTYRGYRVAYIWQSAF
ncbi:MAG: hypothetical protein J1G02_06425 [Clostridiales bacterium]|nr:hypothetical protein [Clostridiales bacterium]